MTNLAKLDHVLATGNRLEVDQLLSDLHTEVHDRPLDHLRVHVAWMKVEASRRHYARAAFHAFAGFVVAMPASLVQRYTGLVVPAFDRARR